MRLLDRALRSCSSPHSAALVAFIVVYLIAVEYFRVVSTHDPTSAFVDPQHAFEQAYSRIRIAQADAFIADVSAGAPQVKAAHPGPDLDPAKYSGPSICLGTATVQREGARYYKTTVGSLLAGLSPAERQDIEVVSLIANTDPRQHLAFNESWLHDLSDQVVTYETLSDEIKAHLATLETPSGHREKALFDYVHLLQTCYDTGSPYIIALEDDVLAMDGWYGRTLTALHQVEAQSSSFDRPVYMRLFYTERFLGWNNEEWPIYLFWSIAAEILLASVLYALHRYHAPSSRFLTWKATALILAVCSPACIALYFAAGRCTVAPLPHGVNRMNNFGCCSQAFAFPRDAVPGVIEFYKERKIGFRDSLLEEYADGNGMTRWAITPSVFQHVGSRSSKYEGHRTINRWDRSSAENIWNFEFERFDAEALRREHDEYIRVHAPN